MDDVVQTVDSVGPVVDVGASGVEDLEVDFIGVFVCGWWRSAYVSKTPNTEGFVASLVAKYQYSKTMDEMWNFTFAIWPKAMSMSEFLLKWAIHHAFVPSRNAY